MRQIGQKQKRLNTSTISNTFQKAMFVHDAGKPIRQLKRKEKSTVPF